MGADKNGGKKGKKPVVVALNLATQEITASQQTFLYLTKPLYPEQVQNFIGPDSSNLKFLSSKFDDLKFDIVPVDQHTSRLVINQEAIDARANSDPGLGLRLASVFYALENVVRNDAKPDEVNLKEALALAFEAQGSLQHGVADYTRRGKKIDKMKIELQELANSAIFEPYVIQATCAEDPKVLPSQTIEFRASGREVYNRLTSGKNAYLKQIQNRVGGITLKTNGVNAPKIIASGPLDKISLVWNFLIPFAEKVAEKDYRKREHLDMALAYAFDETDEKQLPPAYHQAKKKKKSGGKFEFAANINVNKLTPNSDNQRRYVELLENDAYSAVLTPGPAGTGKTYFFLQFAMERIRDYYLGRPGANFRKLILSIPLENVGGKDLGAMPGGIDSKTRPWFNTFYKHLDRILAPLDDSGEPDLMRAAAVREMLMAAGIIEIAPLEHLRGKSFDHALIVLDEAQNAKSEHILTILTRPEETSRLFILGDLGGQLDQNTVKVLHGKVYDVPSTISIDENGLVFLDNDGLTIELGFYEDIGHFTAGKLPETIDSVIPLNGMAESLLLYITSPLIACSRLTDEDVFRSELAQHVQLLNKGLRKKRDNGTKNIPVGRGCANSFALLDKSTRKEAQVGPGKPGERKLAVAGSEFRL
ncbi:MAG: PhoH family protein [Alphaproteobacteria bacterium]|nr:PhoH family protein [Alphaproteobacteria bacterium]